MHNQVDQVDFINKN